MAKYERERDAFHEGRFVEFLSEVRRGAAGRRFLLSGAPVALEEARRRSPEWWDPAPGGWRFLLKCMTDTELLAVPGIGRRRLRAIRAVAPRAPWQTEDDGTPHRDHLAPPPSRGQHPWWLLP